MATYIETKIYEALATKLAALTLSPVVPVIYPNVPSAPPVAGTAYMEASHQPSTVEQINVGDAGRNRHTGLFLINVFAPENQGLSTGMEIAGAVADHFARGVVLTTGGISLLVTNTRIAAPLKEGAYVQMPVVVSYMVDAAN